MTGKANRKKFNGKTVVLGKSHVLYEGLHSAKTAWICSCLNSHDSQAGVPETELFSFYFVHLMTLICFTTVTLEELVLSAFSCLLSFQLPEPQQLNPDMRHKFYRLIMLVVPASSCCDILFSARKLFGIMA